MSYFYQNLPFKLPSTYISLKNISSLNFSNTQFIIKDSIMYLCTLHHSSLPTLKGEEGQKPSDDQKKSHIHKRNDSIYSNLVIPRCKSHSKLEN